MKRETTYVRQSTSTTSTATTTYFSIPSDKISRIPLHHTIPRNYFPSNGIMQPPANEKTQQFKHAGCRPPTSGKSRSFSFGKKMAKLKRFVSHRRPGRRSKEKRQQDMTSSPTRYTNLSTDDSSQEFEGSAQSPPTTAPSSDGSPQSRDEERDVVLLYTHNHAGTTTRDKRSSPFEPVRSKSEPALLQARKRLDGGLSRSILSLEPPIKTQTASPSCQHQRKQVAFADDIVKDLLRPSEEKEEEKECVEGVAKRLTSKSWGNERYSATVTAATGNCLDGTNNVAEQYTIRPTRQRMGSLNASGQDSNQPTERQSTTEATPRSQRSGGVEESKSLSSQPGEVNDPITDKWAQLLAYVDMTKGRGVNDSHHIMAESMECNDFPDDEQGGGGNIKSNKDMAGFETFFSDVHQLFSSAGKKLQHMSSTISQQINTCTGVHDDQLIPDEYIVCKNASNSKRTPTSKAQIAPIPMVLDLTIDSDMSWLSIDVDVDNFDTISRLTLPQELSGKRTSSFSLDLTEIEKIENASENSFF